MPTIFILSPPSTLFFYHTWSDKGFQNTRPLLYTTILLYFIWRSLSGLSSFIMVGPSDGMWTMMSSESVTTTHSWLLQTKTNLRISSWSQNVWLGLFFSRYVRLWATSNIWRAVQLFFSASSFFSWQGLQVFFGCLSNCTRSNTKSASKRKYLTVRFFFISDCQWFFLIGIHICFGMTARWWSLFFFSAFTFCILLVTPAFLNHIVCISISKKSSVSTTQKQLLAHKIPSIASFIWLRAWEV